MGGHGARAPETPEDAQSRVAQCFVDHVLLGRLWRPRGRLGGARVGLGLFCRRVLAVAPLQHGVDAAATCANGKAKAKDKAKAKAKAKAKRR